MDIQAVAFDVNGTLVRIVTEDGMDQIFRSAAHFLTYQGIDLCRHQVRDLYFQIMKEQQRASSEEHPEFDAVGIWRSIIEMYMTDFTRALPAGKWLFDHGFYVQSVAYPAVPVNASVLRIQVNANHPLQAVQGLLEALGHLRKVVELPKASDLAEGNSATVQLGEYI